MEPRNIIASVSGGKDSTALCLWLRDHGYEYRAVHMDTGWEHPETDVYIREVLDDKIGPIEWIRGPRNMRELILQKGIFPSRVRRFCTSYLKIYPLMQWISEQYPHDIVTNAVGIRAEESRARSQLTEWEEHDWATTWRPILQLTEQDVINLHKKHGIPPNPLYLKGASRVGCWPCIFARKKEIALVARLTPERIDEIKELETILSQRAGEPRYYYYPRSIDQAVAWATNDADQYMLFDDLDERIGCMRWGLCDS